MTVLELKKELDKYPDDMVVLTVDDYGNKEPELWTNDVRNYNSKWYKYKEFLFIG